MNDLYKDDPEQKRIAYQTLAEQSPYMKSAWAKLLVASASTFAFVQGGGDTGQQLVAKSDVLLQRHCKTPIAGSGDSSDFTTAAAALIAKALDAPRRPGLQDGQALPSEGRDWAT
eukprot:Skav232011  [mRNA]  locus=scaffold719:855323:856468:+ [translate_table: standard]